MDREYLLRSRIVLYDGDGKVIQKWPADFADGYQAFEALAEICSSQATNYLDKVFEAMDQAEEEWAEENEE